MQQTPRLRPLEFGEIIDGAFRLYVGNFKKLTLIAAIIMLPLGLVTLVAINSMGFGELASQPTSAEITDQEALALLGRVAVGGLSTIILTMLGTALIQAASIRVYADAYQGVDNTWQTSLLAGVRRLAAVVAATVLILLGSTVGLLFCIAPGVWLWTSWYTTVPAMITEGKGVFDSMSRSWNLVKPRFWQTLGILVVSFLLIAVIQQVIGLVLTLVFTPMLAGSIDDPTRVADAFDQFVGFSTMLSTLVEIFTLPFAAAVATVVYFDLRVRAEGFDIEQLIREMGSSDTAGPPLPPTSPDDPFGLDQPER